MEFKRYKVYKDLVVVGAGMPGICAAIQAARLGLSVALINNRGYLGGNASAEIRVSVDGADGTQEFNFYSRESGIIEEIRLENLYRNPQRNPYIWDSVLLDFIRGQENIELFLNTNIDKVELGESDRIEYVSGSQAGSEKRFDFYGRSFLDDTGDGTVGYLAGAEFRMGRESKREFNERIAPEEGDQCVIPSTLTFYAKDTGKPVKYIAPNFALDLTKTDVLNYRKIPKDSFYRFQWYYEIAGNINQIENSEKIIQMHRELVYGIWDYVKNSGEYDSENYDLEYVACVPGKRESRRLMGDYIIKEADLVERRDFEDVVGHGGWSIDLHAIEGFFSRELINKHVFLKGIYQVPYRTGYSRNIENLFMAGRCMSTTHVAFGSTRVMATLSTLGQALGAAAFLCKKYDTTPRGVYQNHIKELQQLLIKHDQYVIGHKNVDPDDLCRKARISVSSIKGCKLEKADVFYKMDHDLALSLPVVEHVDHVYLIVRAANDTDLYYSAYLPRKKENYCPEIKVAEGCVRIKASRGCQWVCLPVNTDVDGRNIFIELAANSLIEIGATYQRLPGVVSMEKDANSSPTIVDVETLDKKEYLWRKMKESICFKLAPSQDVYGPENINNGYARPYGLPNLWVSDDKVEGEHVTIDLGEKRYISEIVLCHDTDLDFRISHQPLEFNAIPETTRDYDILCNTEEGYVKIKEVRGNYQRVNRIKLSSPLFTDSVKILFRATQGAPRVGLFEVRIY